MQVFKYLKLLNLIKVDEELLEKPVVAITSGIVELLLKKELLLNYFLVLFVCLFKCFDGRVISLRQILFRAGMLQKRTDRQMGKVLQYATFTMSV